MFCIQFQQQDAPKMSRKDMNKVFKINTYLEREDKVDRTLVDRFGEAQIKMFMQSYMGRPIYDKDSPDREWDSIFFEDVQKVAVGTWKVHIVQDWLD